jgi:hypothetical protein
LVLAPTESDTNQLMLQSRVAIQAGLDDASAIYGALQLFVRQLDQQSFTYLSDDEVRRFSRSEGARQLQHSLMELL